MKKSIIYPEISLNSFLKMYPQLKITKGHCNHCDRIMISNIPFIDGTFCLGLESAPCECGMGSSKSLSYILIDKVAIKEWKELFPQIMDALKP